jgi:peptidoglycan/xylan/chitin deacetylase (PgdA/CDA1 family)
MKYVCVTMDVEPDIGSTEPEIEVFRDRGRLERLARLCEEKSVPLTAFVVTRLLDEAPALIDAARASLPIRFEVHSHSHDQLHPDSAGELDRAMERYARVFGEPPKGYRAPNGLISPAGLRGLAERGFVYDSSVFPSFRFDEYGYNNLSCPVQPYVYETPKEILEIPLAVVSRVRLVVSLSYIKLLGLGFYKALINTFGLPNIVIFLCHPYDFTLHAQLHRIKGWKRYAHGRNADNAEQIFERFVDYMKSKGYQFVYVDDVVETLDRSSLPRREARS